MALLVPLALAISADRGESALTREQVLDAKQVQSDILRQQLQQAADRGDVATKMTLQNSPDDNVTITFDELPLGMALPIYQTLRDDVTIRITRSGFTFLAQQIQRLLYGWVRRDQLNAEARNAMLMLINDALYGFKGGFVMAGVPVVGDADACILLKNSNDDDGRNNGNFPNSTAAGNYGGNCSCNEPFTADGQHGRNTNFFTDDCTECWINSTPPGGQPGPQAHPPNGGWIDNRAPQTGWNGRLACHTAGTDQTAGNGTGGNNAGATHANNIAYFDDPGNPDNPDNKYWCKGPFYDTFLKWDNSRIDPDCLKTEPEDVNEECPIVGHSDNGVVGGMTGKCDNSCEYWVDPGNSDVAARNDINIIFQNTTNQDQLNIALYARNAMIDARLAFGFSLLGAQCTYASSPQAPNGLFLQPKTLDIRMSVRFVDGYATMYGSDGVAFGGTGSTSSSSTSSGGSGRGDCNSVISTSSSGGPTQFVIDDTLNGDEQLGVALVIDSLTMTPPPTGGELPGFNYYGCSGVLCGVLCDFAGLVGTILNALLSGGSFDATIQGLLGGAVAAILETEVVGILEETLGLPLDFTAMLASHPAANKAGLCALRMPTAADHAKGYTCNHSFNQPNDCNVDGSYHAAGGITSIPCPGYGNCPCDDYDYDGMLNYQDPTPFTTPRSGGYPNQPYTAPLFTGAGDCNRENDGVAPDPGVSDIWCGAWNEAGGDNFYSWQYGVGNFFPDEGGVYYETGAFADVFWDDGGMTISLSAGIAPWRDYFPNPNPPMAIFNPFQGKVPDPAATNYSGVRQKSGGGDMLWSDFLSASSGSLPTRSCYYDPAYVGAGNPQDNLWTDSTQRDRNRSDLDDASSELPRWVVAQNSAPGSTDLWVKRFDYTVASGGQHPADYQVNVPGTVRDISVSKQGDLVVVGTANVANNSVYVYRRTANGWVHDTGSPLPHPDATITAVAISPSGTYAAAGGSSGRIQVYRHTGSTWLLHAVFYDDPAYRPYNFTGDCANCYEASLCPSAAYINVCPCQLCNSITSEPICGSDQCAVGPAGSPTPPQTSYPTYEICGCENTGGNTGIDDGNDGCNNITDFPLDWRTCGCETCGFNPTTVECFDCWGGLWNLGCDSANQACGGADDGSPNPNQGPNNLWGVIAECDDVLIDSDNYICGQYNCESGPTNTWGGCANARNCNCGDSWATTATPRQASAYASRDKRATIYGAAVCTQCAGDASGDLQQGCTRSYRCEYCSVGLCNDGATQATRWVRSGYTRYDIGGAVAASCAGATSANNDGICQPGQCTFGTAVANNCRACNDAFTGAFQNQAVHNVPSPGAANDQLRTATQCRGGQCVNGCAAGNTVSCQPHVGVDGLCPPVSGTGTGTAPSCGNCSKSLDGHRTSILDMAWHPSNDAYLVSSSGGVDKRALLWNPTIATNNAPPFGPRTRQIYNQESNTSGGQLGAEVAYSDTREVVALAWNADGTRLAFALDTIGSEVAGDGHVDKIYGIDVDSTPLKFADGVNTRNALTWQGPSTYNFNAGCSAALTQRVFDVAWRGTDYYVIAGRCTATTNNLVRVQRANLAYGQGSSAGGGIMDRSDTDQLPFAGFAGDGRVIYVENLAAGNDRVWLWDWENAGLGTFEDHQSGAPLGAVGNIAAFESRSGSEITEIYDDWDTFKVPAGNSIVFMTSQQFLQELFYTFYYSGMLCIDFSSGDSDLLDSLLKVESMRSLVTFLGDVCPGPGNCTAMGIGNVAPGEFIWSQQHGVRVKFRPKDLPVVKVLGGRLNDCFPDGDLIPSSGLILDAVGGGQARVNDSLTDIHYESPDCADASQLTELERRVYDLMVYLPFFQVEFWAPLSNATVPNYDPENHMQLLFTEDLHLALVMAIEHSKPWNVSVPTSFSGTASRFFEIMIDAAIGCGGNQFNNTFASFDTDWYDAINNNCDIDVKPAATNVISSVAGVSDLVHTLLNSTLSTVIQGELTLAGITADFYKIGAGFPVENNGAADTYLDIDRPTAFGGQTPDYLVGAAKFVGAIDFSAVFGLLGAPALADKNVIDTRIGLADRTIDGFAPANVFEQKIELSLRESYQAGLGEENPRLSLAADYFAQDLEGNAITDGQIQYSWRLGDKGNWHPYKAANYLQLPRLPTGKYNLQVKARRPDQIVDATPAELVFYVDRTPPVIRVFDAEGNYLPQHATQLRAKHGNLTLKVDENMSQPRDVDVVYALDDGEWQAWREGDVLPVGEFVRYGASKLRIRALDDFRNVGEVEYTILSGGGGCGAGAGGPGNLLVYAMAVLLLFYWRRGDRSGGKAVALGMAAMALVGAPQPADAMEFVWEIGEPFEESLEFESALDPAAAALFDDLALAGAAAVTAVDNGFFLYLNAFDNGSDMSSVPNCQANPSHDECVSFIRWTERTIVELLEYRPFQDALDNLIAQLLSPPAEDVCFYPQVNYVGTPVCYRPGYIHESVDQLSLGANNNVFRSVRVPAGMIAYVYENGNFQIRSWQTTAAFCLNDNAGTLQVVACSDTAITQFWRYENATQRIINASSGRCINVASGAAGTNATVTTCNTSNNQRFYWQGNRHFAPLLNTNNVLGYSGAILQVQAKAAEPANLHQKWHFQRSYFQLRNGAAGNYYCLGVNSTVANSSLVAKTCSDTDLMQFWRWDNVNQQLILQAAPSMCIDDTAGAANPAVNTIPQIRACSSTATSQKWKRSVTGLQYVSAVKSNALAIANSSLTEIRLQTQNSASANQRWYWGEQRLVQDVPDLTSVGLQPLGAGVNRGISAIRVIQQGTPLIDEVLDIPAIGSFGLGFFIRDLWGDGSSGLGDRAWGPRAVTNPNYYVGQVFQDTDTTPTDIVRKMLKELPAGYTVDVRATGPAGNVPLANLMFNGGVRLTFTTTKDLDLDVMFAQPASPPSENVVGGIYFHGAGKMRLKAGLQLIVEVYTNAGNLRELRTGRINGRAAGYDIGLGLKYAKVAGEIVLDLNAMHCWHEGEIRSRFCSAQQLDPLHPFYDNQVDYQDDSQTTSQLLGDAIQYLEAAVVYEAERASGAVEDILTATALFDLRDFTHTKEVTGTYNLPEIDHPLIPGEVLQLDYSGFWRFNAKQSMAADGGFALPGGFGLDVRLKDPAPGWCSFGNSKPPSAGADAVAKPMADLSMVNTVRANRAGTIGFGIHMDPINRLLDRVFEDHVLCMTIDRDTQVPVIGDFINDLFVTDAFQDFVPSIPADLMGREIEMRIRPRYYAPMQTPANFVAALDQPSAVVCNAQRPCYPVDLTGYIQSTAGGPVWVNNELAQGPYDMQLNLPHLEVQFDIAPSSSDPSRIPLFSLDVSVGAWVGLGLYQVVSSEWPELAGGNCDQSPSPCRVARLSLALQSKVNALYELNPGPGDTTTYTYIPEDLENGINQILTMLLNGAIAANLEVVLDVGSTTGIGMTLDPVTDGTPVSGQYKYGIGVEALDFVVDASDEPQYVALYVKPSDNIGGYNEWGTASTLSPDGYADVLPPDFIFSLLEDAGLFEVPDIPGLGAALPDQSQVEGSSGPLVTLTLPQSEWRGSHLSLSASDVRAAGLQGDNRQVDLQAYTSAQGAVWYQYQIDDGFYQTTPLPAVKLPMLADGKHLLKVWAIQSDGVISTHSATLEFAVDRFGPRIVTVGDPEFLGQGGQILLKVDVRDSVSSPEKIATRWRIDDGEWQALANGGQIASRVKNGAHVLTIVATDESGNQSQREFRFQASGAGGCSTAGAGAIHPLAWAFVLAVYFAWRWQKHGVHRAV